MKWKADDIHSFLRGKRALQSNMLIYTDADVDY